MKIVVAKADYLSEYFDRRTQDKIRYLLDEGHHVTHIGISQQFQMKIEENFVQIGIPVELAYLSDDFRDFKHSVQLLAKDENSNTDILEISVTSNQINTITSYTQNVKEKLKKIILKMPNSIQGIVYSVYGMYRKRTKVSIKNTPRDPNWLTKSFLLYLGGRNLDCDLWIGVDIPGSLAGFTSSKLKKQKTKVWFDANEYYTEQPFFGLVNPDKNVVRKIENFLVRKSDFFTTVSAPLLKIMLSESGAIKRNNAAVLNNVAKPGRKGEDSISNHYFKVAENKKLLIAYGSLDFHKGLEKQLISFPKDQEFGWNLILMGFRYSSELEQIANENPNIEMLDPVKESNLHSVLLKADAFLLNYTDNSLNTKYGFPNKLGDAITLRKPIIYSSNLQVVSEIAQKYKIGIELPLNSLADDWRKVLSKLELEVNVKNWDLINRELGWKSNACLIDSILDSISAD